MWNLKKKKFKWSYLQNRLTNKKQTYGYQRGKEGGGINWEIGIDIYTLLYIKWVTNKDLLYSTGNYIQYFTITYEWNEKNLCTYIFIYNWIAPDGDCSHEIKRRLLLGRKVMTNLDSIFKSRDITLPTKSSQGYGFSCGYIWMWELDCEEGWVPKNWRFWTVVLEKTLESPLDCKEIQPVHSEGDQPWVFSGRNDAKAETPVLWPPHAKSWLIGKDSDAGRDWGQEEKGTPEDEMAGWHHWLDGRESRWTPGVGDGQGGLACCDSWGCRVGHDWATELNWTESLCYTPETL